MKRALLIIFSVLFIDQVLKIWVKTHMYIGEEHYISGRWFIIHFTENPGMAFGLEFGGAYGKIFLSVFRIAASFALGYYVFYLVKKKANAFLITCFSFIFAGAVGNILDSAFYGLIFSDSNAGLAKLFPAGGGYETFLHGRVVDMLYFPLINGHFPQWFPFWGGQEFIFFRPIFNIADASISIGVLLILLFQRKAYKKTDDEIIIESQEVNEEKLNMEGGYKAE